MRAPTDLVARLDMAARAKSSEAVVARLRWILLFLSVFVGALAIISMASFYETLYVRAAAGFTGFTTVVLWSNSRYKLVFPALLFLFFAIGDAFLNWPPLNESNRIGSLFGFVGLCLLASYYFWKQAGIFAAVNTPEWNKERSQVEAWWRILTAPESHKEEVIEFSTGSFWSGYYTYRLMKPGPCWAVAKLWKGKIGARSDYRVRQLSGVSFAANPDGRMNVTIEGITISTNNIFPPMFASGGRPAL